MGGTTSSLDKYMMKKGMTPKPKPAGRPPQGGAASETIANYFRGR